MQQRQEEIEAHRLRPVGRGEAAQPERERDRLLRARLERDALETAQLVTLTDEDQQSEYLIRRILEHHEAGIPLKKQAVLFRTAYHSDALEVELGRRNIPFVKYGGLKFLEAAHVKDVLSILRLAENPRDQVALFTSTVPVIVGDSARP